METEKDDRIELYMEKIGCKCKDGGEYSPVTKWNAWPFNGRRYIVQFYICNRCSLALDLIQFEEAGLH